jgi:P pilus assembly chaperone PapD
LCLKYWLKFIVCFLFLGSAALQTANAGGFSLDATRVIYNSAQKEATLNVNNSGSSPFLIQSWAETQNGEKAPFFVTPPLFRLDANQQNLLRIIRVGEKFPEDRESLYWLNVKAIPSRPETEANTLQIAVKKRIKLIYRPTGLKGLPEEVASQLTWVQSGGHLTVNNPTPFYMNFFEIKVGGGGG